MSLIQSQWAKGVKQVPTSREANGVVAALFEIDFADLDTNSITIADGDIIELAGLPAYHTIVDATLINDDLDSDGSPAADVDIGIMSGDFGEVDDSRTCGDELFDGSTALQAAAVNRLALATGFRVAKANNHRSIGVKFNTAPATQPTTGKLQLLLQYKQ